MAKQLLSVGTLMLILSACGLEELESMSKFISKTQEDPTLADTNKHIPGGAHANAYLINKVHVKDNDDLIENCDETRLGITCNLTAEVLVGWWGITTDNCSNCTSQKGITNAGQAPTPTGTTGGDDPAPCACGYEMCVSNAVAKVNEGINMWLDPLRKPYGSVANPIVSGNYVNDSTKRKTKSDLLIHFLCSAKNFGDWDSSCFDEEIWKHGNTNDGKGSCFQYRKQQRKQTLQ